MLVIEGTDLVGKTTLAYKFEKLLAERGYYHFLQHMTKPPSSFDYYYGYERQMRHNVIADRFFLSHLAYSSALKIEPKISRTCLELLAARLVTFSGFTIILTAQEKLLQSRIAAKNREEMFCGKVILGANRYFTTCLFDCLFDYLEDKSVVRFRETESEPFPSDEWVAAICDIYIKHLQEVCGVLHHDFM